MSLCFCTMPWIMRAIWSAPPPAPAGTMNSTVVVGFHSAWASPAPTTPKTNAPANRAAADTNSGFSAFRDIQPPPGFDGQIDSRPAFFHCLAPSTHSKSIELVLYIPYTKSNENLLELRLRLGVR